MAESKRKVIYAGVSDEAVRSRTGKGWTDWFKLLDRAGCKEMTHPQIVTIVGKQRGTGYWWQQMITVAYEQARGLRAKHQKTDGFSVSVSKTVPVGLSTLFGAWANVSDRKEWLKDPAFTVRKATRNKSMRITWVDGRSSVEVNFYSKGAGKSMVTVQHNKLSNATAAARWKSYWGNQLKSLSAHLNTAS